MSYLPSHPAPPTLTNRERERQHTRTQSSPRGLVPKTVLEPETDRFRFALVISGETNSNRSTRKSLPTLNTESCFFFRTDGFGRKQWTMCSTNFLPKTGAVEAAGDETRSAHHTDLAACEAGGCDQGRVPQYLGPRSRPGMTVSNVSTIQTIA